MKKAGGILIAKTNPPEFSYWIESDNLLTGRSSNPWDFPRRPAVRAAVNRRRSRPACRRSVRHRPCDFGPRPGRADRRLRLEANAWPYPDDRHLAARAASLLARLAHGPFPSAT